MIFKDTDVTTHFPVDTSDPGFAIKGVKLRWISGAVEARRAGRIWQPLKISMLPKKVLDTLKASNGSWFATGGDTIRKRGDLTLSFAPLEQVEARKRELRKQQNANEAVFKGSVGRNDQVQTDLKNTGVGTEVVRGEASSQFE